MGDLSQRDVAQTITNVTNNLGEAVSVLRADLEVIEGRIATLEQEGRQHSSERQALTRLLTMLATESRTVGDVHQLLERQLDGEHAERDQRRRYLDTMLTALVALAVLNTLFHIFQWVLRRSGRAAQPYTAH
jgi:type VI protein secretion system component VasF